MATPTAAPTPTPSPTPTATPAPNDGTINADSSAEDVRELQQLLVEIDMLPADSISGVYGSETIAAVAGFQQWVNLKRAEQTLAVNGEADPLTLA